MSFSNQNSDFEFTKNRPISFKGKQVEFQDEGFGKITDETVDSIYIISQFFTGWMFKAEYFDLLGVED
jgi:hypothetical protein